jgi:L-cysteine desulfidase
MNLFIINTNRQASDRYELEMIDEQKCAAYRSTKGEIVYIQKDDKVLLYSNGKGVIAKGVADGEVKKKDDNGEVDAEFYMSLNEFYQYHKAIPYKDIRKILQDADPSFARPFNVTSLKFSSPASQEIWDEVSKFV